MINFISNLPSDLRSGGFSAMNAAGYSALSGRFPVNYVGPINPPRILWQKAISKAFRIAGLQGDYFFFSQRRLEIIADEVHRRSPAGAALDFFHGFTPWVLTRPQRPYMTWCDCSFHEYINIYHRREQFTDSDIERIERLEGLWLKNARMVILRSQWAADRTAEFYGLDRARVRSVGGSGEIEMPASDVYSGGKEFAFVSTNFRAKGGYTVLAAFRKVRKRHPGASLVIVGERPRRLLAEPGVSAVGYLRKEVPGEVERYRHILGHARALIHPTTADISPLILLEAGYFGCPAITSRRFAIPEMVDDRSSGWLLDDPSSADAVAEAMNWMLEQEAEYQAMRRTVWTRTREHTKSRFEGRLIAAVSEVLEQCRVRPA